MVKIKKFPIGDFRFAISDFRSAICHRRLTRLAGLISAALILSIANYHSQIAIAQEPQAPAGTPLYSANAKYVNGMAPGYWATAGSGLTLNVSAATAYCGNPPAPVSYPGGTLTLAASATNYIYLDPANNCAPAASTSAFKTGEVPIATAVTGASSITSVTDARTWFTPQPCVTGSGGALNCSSMGTNQNITLTPSGTGASVITNLQDQGGQVFNVKAYGAKGDGTTNDSPAFQAAYAAAVAAGGGTVYIPPASGCYLLNTAINMTEDYTTVTMLGSGGKPVAQSGSGGAICGNTGGVVFDLTNSGYKTLENIDVTAQKAGLSNPSTVGILFARNASGNSGQLDRVIDCTFVMPLHTSGTSYTFGAYLYGAEITFMSRDLLEADYPLVVSSANSFNVSSPFDTLGTATTYSETDTSFRDMELLTAGLGPAVFIHKASDMILTGHSWNFSQANPYPGGLYNYAFEIYQSQSLQINWRQEGFPGFAYIDMGLDNSTIQATHATAPTPTLHAIEFNNASSELKNDVFKIYDSPPSSTNWYYDATGGSPTGVAVLDNVDFYCGNETNCVNIPTGNYATGGATYWSKITWSGSSLNKYPVIMTGPGTGAPVTGNFTIPTTSVPADSCVSLPTVPAAGGVTEASIRFAPQEWYNLIVTGDIVSGVLTPKVCNPTSSAIAPSYSTGVTFRVTQ